MDTSISSDFRPFDLLQSVYPEDREHYLRTVEIVGGIVLQLKPVLKYVSGPIEFCNPCDINRHKIENSMRALDTGCHIDDEFVGEGKDFVGGHLFLDELGTFFVAQKLHGNHYYHYVGGMVWQYLSFEKLIKSLRDVLRIAATKREIHLKAIKMRQEKLDKLAEVLRS